MSSQTWLFISACILLLTRKSVALQGFSVGRAQPSNFHPFALRHQIVQRLAGFSGQTALRLVAMLPEKPFKNANSYNKYGFVRSAVSLLKLCWFGLCSHCCCASRVLLFDCYWVVLRWLQQTTNTFVQAGRYRCCIDGGYTRGDRRRLLNISIIKKLTFTGEYSAQLHV